MNNILFIVPSRERPDNVKELMEAWKLGDEYASLLVAIDDDDPMFEEYAALGCSLSIAPRKPICGILNPLATSYADAFDAIGFMGDDHRPRTHGWDKRLFEELQELKTGVVYGNDLLQRDKLPTQVVMSSDIIQTLGFMAPPTLEHLYLDNFWLSLGKSLNRIKYLDDVIIEHLHPVAEKAQWDDSYRLHNSDEQYDKDRKAYDQYMRTHFIHDVEKIKL